MVYGVRHWNSDFIQLMQMHWSVLGQYFIWPDAVFIFDVSVPTALQRLVQKDARRFDAHEQTETLVRIKSNYRHLPDVTFNCHLVDGEGESNQIAQNYQGIIDKLLRAKFLKLT